VDVEGSKDATLVADTPLMEEKEPATYRTLLRAHPVRMDPPEFVVPSRIRDPSLPRAKSVEVEGSNEAVEVEKRSRPANAPARPTFPMRSKSTWGAEACERRAKERRARHSE